MLLLNDDLALQLVSTLPADASLYAGQVYLAPRWPLVGSLPGTVVDGQRLRIAEVGQDYGREYLGVGGAWVPQDAVTMAMWVWEDGEWVLQDNWLTDDDGNLILTDDGKRISIDSQTAVIALNPDGSIAKNIDGSIALLEV